MLSTHENKPFQQRGVGTKLNKQLICHINVLIGGHQSQEPNKSKIGQSLKQRIQLAQQLHWIGYKYLIHQKKRTNPPGNSHPDSRNTKSFPPSLLQFKIIERSME